MKVLKRSLLLATTALLLTAPVLAQGFAQNRAEQQFMSDAAQDGMVKMQLAYLALQNAQNEQVKAYAEQILNDYGQAQNDLIFIANQNGVLLPKDLDDKNQAAFDALSQLHGADFDKAYMKAMLNQHQTGVPRFKEEAAKLDNHALVDWASKTLPTLQGDLKEAQKVAPVVGVESKPASKTGKKKPEGSADEPATKTPSQEHN